MSFRRITILALGFSALTALAHAQGQSPTIGARAAGEATYSAEFSDQQREQIRASILETDTHQPTPKTAEPAVGKEVPSSINLHPFPQPLAREIPELQRLMYAFLDRDVLIVDALADKVVAMLPLSGDAVQSGSTRTAASVLGGLRDFSDEQLMAIYQSASPNTQPVPREPVLRAGIALPENVTIQPLPEQVAAQVPQAHGLQYVKLSDGRLLLVNPQDRIITGIITSNEGAVASNSHGPGNTLGQGSSDPKAGQNTGQDSNAADPLEQMEKSGNPSAYTGPSTGGPNTD